MDVPRSLGEGEIEHTKLKYSLMIRSGSVRVRVRQCLLRPVGGA